MGGCDRRRAPMAYAARLVCEQIGGLVPSMMRRPWSRSLRTAALSARLTLQQSRAVGEARYHDLFTCVSMALEKRTISPCAVDLGRCGRVADCPEVELRTAPLYLQSCGRVMYP